MIRSIVASPHHLSIANQSLQSALISKCRFSTCSRLSSETSSTGHTHVEVDTSVAEKKPRRTVNQRGPALPLLNLDGSFVGSNAGEKRRTTTTTKPFAQQLKSGLRKSLKKSSTPTQVAEVSQAGAENVEDEEMLNDADFNELVGTSKSKSSQAGGVKPDKLKVQIDGWLAKYPDALLLTQVGSFFESYFDQAITVSQILSIKLTSKVFDRTRHPFAGFPLSQLSKHVSTLVESGWKVVIVEETSRTGAVIERLVTRIVTPGTGFTEGFVKEDEMNFVLAVGLPVDESESSSEGELIGLAYRDISTGASFTRTTTFDQLVDDLALIDAKEIVVDARMKAHPLGARYYKLITSTAERTRRMLSTVSPPEVLPFSTEESPQDQAGLLLNTYLSMNLPLNPPPRIPAQHVDPLTVLQMSATTLESLEIKESMRGGTRGSLLHTIKRTVTPGGARLLAERICSPSTVATVIRHRLDLISWFHRHGFLTQDLRDLLRTLDDSSKLLQRLYMRRGTAFDLLGLRRSILVADQVKQSLVESLASESAQSDEIRAEQAAIRVLVAALDNHSDLAAEIGDTIDEAALLKREIDAEKKAGISEVLGSAAAERAMELDEEASDRTVGLWGKNEEWVIRPTLTKKLRLLHAQLTFLRTTASNLESDLRKKYNSAELSLKVIPRLGAAVHVFTRNTDCKLIETEGEMVALVKSGSTRSYSLPEWITIYARIVAVSASIRKLEVETTDGLTAKLLTHYPTLQSASDTLSELDVTLGFTELANEMRLVRPLITDETTIKITNGRHPTVEQSLLATNESFTPHTLSLSHPHSFLHLITAPNASGKSTMLRLTAIVTILAQVGSFVPADYAEVGIVDRIFTRIGARDEVDRGRSTFVIEMEETAEILRKATKKSLVLFDEVGRGTSPLDGLSISYAVLNHLVTVNQSRTLFATHFHDLARLMDYDERQLTSCDYDKGEMVRGKGTGTWQGVEFWCADVKEDEHGISYSYTLRRGLNPNSYGIAVAKLAGVPLVATRVAAEVQLRLKEEESRFTGR